MAGVLLQRERNIRIRELTNQINDLIPIVLAETHFSSILSLNATYGGKMQQYANVKYHSFNDYQSFILKYIEGFTNVVSSLDFATREDSPYYVAYNYVQQNANVRHWLYLFLERAFLKNYDAYTRKKPSIENSLIWIGQERASYGIAIVPRFNDQLGQWENDQSEIRRFPHKYFSVGHIMETGLLIPFKNKRQTFSSLEEFLSFYCYSIVRLSGSCHEMNIAERYCNYVSIQTDPYSVPLLIPELRYNGIESQHRYRLDFCIMDYENSFKVGFELSPWSTHGKITKVKEKTQDEVNREAQYNYYREIQKMRDFFFSFGISVVSYTDQDLSDYDDIFSDISNYLSNETSPAKMLFTADSILNSGI